MTRRYCWATAIALVIVCATLAWAQRSTQQFPPLRYSQLRGQVRLPDGRPAFMGIVVYLETRSGSAVGVTETDRLGKFEFQQVLPDYYTVRVRAIEYQEYTEEVDLAHSPTSFLTVELKPDRNSTAPVVPGATVSVETLNAPVGARKNLENGRELLSKGKDLDKSIQFFKKAIEDYPRYSEAYLLMGLAYSVENDPSDANKALHKAIELNADSAPAYIALGSIQNGQKDFAAAEKSLLKAVELNPDSPEAQFQLARTYWALGRWKDADPHAAKAEQLMPDNPQTHVMMGNIQLRKRDGAGALKEYQEALRLAPDSPLAPNIRQMVAKLEVAMQNPKQ